MDTTSAAATETITVQGQAPAPAKSHLWAGDHFSFHDLLDTINPLQHIPIVSTIYRAVTGDTPGNAARVVGDGLYGGVLGVIGGLLDVSVLEATGKDIGGNVMAALEGDGKPADDTKAEAASGEPSPPAAVPADMPVPQPKPPVPATAERIVEAGPPPAVPPAPTGIPLARTAAAPLMPLNAAPKLMALDAGQARGIPIDTSPEGILALRATANNTPRPVPLNIPAGTLAPSQRIPLTGAEFVQRMQDGLDKYKALVQSREATSAGSAVDQVQ